jgi:TRAP-type uncharacterized transport system fused permease subunit
MLPAILYFSTVWVGINADVPTTAAYVICVSVAGPALIALGIGLYIIPLAMVANPDVIRLAFDPGSAVLNSLEIALGLAGISYGVIARRSLWLRAVLIVVGALIIFLL